MLSEEDIAKTTGLWPKAWICVGSGFAREEVKEALLQRGRGVVGRAVTTLEELAASLLPGQPVALDGLGRQEVLRLLMGEPRISRHLPELRRMRRQGGFFARLDRAIQSGRLVCAHEEEEQVIEARLEERFGESAVRQELRVLGRTYEAWLRGSGFWDLPLLLHEAIRILSESELSGLPEEIIVLSLERAQSLEQSFWELLGQRVNLVWKPEFPEQEVGGAAAVLSVRPGWKYERWHTADDACESVAQVLSAISREDLPSYGILIADSPALKRSLKRALSNWGVPEADPRDPGAVRVEEGIKQALLPLEMTARAFPRESVSSWLLRSGKNRSQELFQIEERGIRQGLRSYAGGALSQVHQELERIVSRFGGRKSCEELASAHLEWLTEESSAHVGFFRGIWERWREDLRRVGKESRKAAPLYWLEQLKERLAQTPAPPPRVRARTGIRVYRLGQIPLEMPENVFVIGLSARWLSGEGVGDLWYGEREREALAAEFQVRSTQSARRERERALRFWEESAKNGVFLETHYDAEGREQEALFESVEEGAHPRWRESFGTVRSLPPQVLELPPLQSPQEGESVEISATTLERASRCLFQALAFDRWRVRDTREPEPELWPDARGNILHEAVRILVSTRGPDGKFRCSAEEALERAWKLKPPRGWIGSPRLAEQQRRRMVKVLEAFCRKEEEYFERSEARAVFLDEKEFTLRFEIEYESEKTVFRVKGKPDRVDESIEGGLFIIDYKTSSDVPGGRDMLEKGYRLQLPFYALAAGEALGKPVHGAQFIQLTRQATRSSGVFFSRFNGKEKGKLTQVRSNSKSLLSLEPEEGWEVFLKHIEKDGGAYVRGKFAAMPKEPSKECLSCSASDLCGFRRKVTEEVSE